MVSLRRKGFPLWRLAFFALVISQFALLVFLFGSEPDHTTIGHVSPHLLHHQSESSRKTDDAEHDYSAERLRPDEALPISDHEEELHKHDFHLDGKIDGKSAWENLDSIPPWLKEYFSWHQQQVRLLNENNWKDFKFLVLQCAREDPHCGGASDRIKPIPLLLMHAYRHKRIFLIWWTRPCPLEEFLIPNAMNWSVPSYMNLSNYSENGKLVASNNGLIVWTKKSNSIIRSRLQTYDGGQLEFEKETNTTYNDIYHDLFRLLFEPSPAIRKILVDEMSEAGLVPGDYAVAHYRAFYARASRNPDAIRKTAINAVNCASQLRPGGPVYFASDSIQALSDARAYAKTHGYKVVTIENQEPLHLDKAGNWSTRHASDFYSIFVDLYLMGMGRCLTYGQGGFGKFGALLGYNASCVSRHFYKRNMNICEWATA